jgi:hypothetical protein
MVIQAEICLFLLEINCDLWSSQILLEPYYYWVKFLVLRSLFIFYLVVIFKMYQERIRLSSNSLLPTSFFKIFPPF